MQKPHICIVSPGLNMGGIERASSSLANNLYDNSFKVTFIAVFNHKDFYELTDGITHIKPLGFNKSKIDIPRTIKYLRKEIKKSNPSKVIVFNKFYAGLTALSLFRTKIGFFLSERSSPLYKWKKKIEFINRFSFSINPPKGVIAQTKIAAEYQRKYYSPKVKIKVIPNSLRQISLYPEIKRKNQIISVGRVDDYLKGFDRLIDLYKLNEKIWPLIIVGAKEGENDLNELINKNNLSHRIKVLPATKQIDKLYAESKIFIIPSRSEGFPNALCEAMAAGLACVAFDFIAGPRDIIKPDQNGIIVPQGDVNKLSERIEYLTFNEGVIEKLGQEAMKIEEELSESIILNEIIDFINS